MDIIPNIPDEIGRECLLKVSYNSHDKLKAVCRSWEAMLSSPQFYEDRKISGTSEQFICLIQAIPKGNSADDKWQATRAYGLTLYDPLQGAWDRLPSIPEFPDGIPLFCECFWVDQKLVMIGGWNPSRWEAMNSVFIYDFTSGKWRRGADMERIRSFFACAVSPSGLIYVAGGHENNKNALRTAEAYDVKHDKWEALPPMNQERDRCHGVFLDGKFTVISGYSTESQGRFDKSSEVFDHSTGVWSKVENMWSIGECPRSCLVSLGHLYFFHNQQLMRYNGKENAWELVASLPESMEVATCATVWRDKVFVSGSTSRWGEQVFYMFDNPGKWVPIENSHDFLGFVQNAITVEM
jgi:hypothetical protein